MAGLLANLGGNPLNTPVGQKIEQATDASLPSENWTLNMEICDLINETDEGPKDAVKAIRKRLQQNTGKNYTVVLYALTVLETCVKNCGRRFHLLISQKDFILELVKLIGPKNDPPTAVQEKVLSLIQEILNSEKTIFNRDMPGPSSQKGLNGSFPSPHIQETNPLSDDEDNDDETFNWKSPSTFSKRKKDDDDEDQERNSFLRLRKKKDPKMSTPIVKKRRTEEEEDVVQTQKRMANSLDKLVEIVTMLNDNIVLSINKQNTIITLLAQREGYSIVNQNLE